MITIARLDPQLPGVGERLLGVQRAAYLVEAELIGDDRIPTLSETLDELRAARLSWTGAFDDDGVLVGAIGWSVAGDLIDVERLVVDPAAHRQGIGRRLVQVALDMAAGRGLTVSTGRDNAPALALYRSLGFRDVEDVEVVPGLWITRLRTGS
ncbi:GNAT family N-acetyltransferase [Nakamurella sp. YIM 132087]|uniref:GNAT family N-acetyltransferase n=1 Tax=Nakamurella alba TaxID=2665158 RepID=A0A7K1FNR5_9ACTN|nr:GNAT family N-acetyltransferase [Nakamurella alba]MTD14863.1 GNAT family N-acetyltransferase [Nakamurella alba]